MLDAHTHAALARELHEAERTRVQVSQFSRRHPGMTIDDSYAIQRAWMQLKHAVLERARASWAWRVARVIQRQWKKRWRQR